MRELLRTNDAVLISFVVALLREARIDYVVVDQNMSILEGSVGILPRRVLVTDDDFNCARGVLGGAGLGNQISKL